MVTQSSLINRVTSVGQSSAINNQPAIKDEPRIETLRPLTVYLNLQLVDDDGSDDPPSSNKRVIKQGKSYNMVVYASDTRNPVVPQTELKTTSDIDILLECMIDGNIHPIITIENPFRTMTYEQVALKEDVFSYDENYVQFHLTVPGECPIGAVTFQLSFRKAHTK